MKNRKNEDGSARLCCSIAAILLLYAIIMIGTYFGELENRKMLKSNLKNVTLSSYKGNVTMEELNEQVYKPFGYEIIHPTLPVPTLRMLRQPSCSTIFSDWLKISQQPQPVLPPREIPVGLEKAYLLNNYANVTYRYNNDKNSKAGQKPTDWNRLSEMMEWGPENITNIGYGREGMSVHYAMKNHSLDGLSGVIIGSMKPWVEILALQNGAKHLLTVEYNQLNIQPEFQDRMDSIFPTEIAENWEKYADSFDFAASFSSIEHSGIGRYGDPMDPIGDLREMQKVRCLLKKGGLFFFGAPTGIDAILFNLHRIYGPIRFAMMMTGYELVDVFTEHRPEAMDLKTDNPFLRRQKTLVLRKV